MRSCARVGHPRPDDFQSRQANLVGGKGGDSQVDDSKLPPQFPVKTNFPGKLPGGRHLFLNPDEAIQKMVVAKGFKVDLFASEREFPELTNLVQMAWDTQGRLWVAVWPSYPHWKPGDPYNDKLLILEDTDGDGKADKLTTFADGLHCPTGFEFVHGGVLVAQAPDIMFLKDTEGKGKATLRQRIVHGIDSADTHHTSNSFVLDPAARYIFRKEPSTARRSKRLMDRRSVVPMPASSVTIRAAEV